MDILEELRDLDKVFYEYEADDGALLDRAADEIERLREALKKIGDGDECIRLLVYPSRCKRAYDARAALKGDE